LFSVEEVERLRIENKELKEEAVAVKSNVKPWSNDQIKSLKLGKFFV
jgi:hypothetical protein